ncbi:unnamed protein product, partial [marine sediment metagenome]
EQYDDLWESETIQGSGLFHSSPRDLKIPNHLYKYRISLNDSINPIVYYYFNFTNRKSYEISAKNVYPANQIDIPINNLTFSFTLFNPDYFLDYGSLYLTTLEVMFGSPSIHPLPHADELALDVTNGIDNTIYSIDFLYPLNYSTQYDYIISDSVG